MQVLIVGDSFAADWSVQNAIHVGWPNLLAKQVSVNNLARAGISQFRILQQLQSVCLDDYNWILVCNTSPLRMVTRQHPVHVDALHSASDLIFADLEYHQSNLSNNKNPALTCAYDFFRYHYDEDFQCFVYHAVLKSMLEILQNHDYIFIHTPLVPDYVVSHITIKQQDMQKYCANHLSDSGNLEVYQKICDIIYA
jgi:hypothetical protein